MVRVIYRNRNRIAAFAGPIIAQWVIRKRYRFCHLTNADTPWAVRDYYR